MIELFRVGDLLLSHDGYTKLLVVHREKLLLYGIRKYGDNKFHRNFFSELAIKNLRIEHIIEADSEETP